mmetsp:Transcript_32352/g.69210  ORF Transcript_32352/g.69210 Transcript_32352/m.69210 type:complete len:628 (+) Transcript_32352:120-2003(+)|eukprot:CAMPEP_0206431422 /NCGR_PEP_ID=MMETSP0324_2-20121206/7357_1 /ASSEMBLY_ACC=CAM_ASM_000836 /TAXON_ID=2866 /ORGANISM="Crypthecodinium cohnii, Strain Seligo" /LENGTH=627 /DNA_ID=CAMNT_0053897351 /DNA_START=81 /DNA_END=1964 /DNA_ORIENTATION=+
MRSPLAAASDLALRPVNKLAELRGIPVTSEDMVNPHAGQKEDVHAASQELFATLLRHRGISSYSRAPCIGTDSALSEDSDRSLLARSLLDGLRMRGIHGIRQFRTILHSMDVEGRGTVSSRTFQGALTHMGVRTKEVEYEKLTQLFSVPDCDDEVDYVRFLTFGCTNWSDQRQRAVQDAYEALQKVSPGGHVDVSALARTFDPRAFTCALIPDLIEHEASQEFLRCWSDWNLQSDGIIRPADFVDYYHDVSLWFSSDQDFCNFVCKSWQINPDDWLARHIFRRYASPDNPNILPKSHFYKMLLELDPTTNAEEAAVWYKAIDKDHDGEVDVVEFVYSKVLKTKRLFDQFAQNSKRCVDKATMMRILKYLSPHISDEDADIVYGHADQDNSGEVSFFEVIDNNLLSLLQILDDIDRSKTGTYSEADVRALFRKLDPRLDNHDIKHIYKAIDVDGSGSISFAEFCESQVLKAHALFERYDVTHSGSLTQFKFRELLLDLDESLSIDHMNAIFKMCSDSETGKVTFGGFLNPNVVKIKMLFDKYDEDRSKSLDPKEFRTMLKDIYRGASDADIETIVDSVCPVDKTSAFSFLFYISHYKAISRKHEAIHLAKRRKDKEKARARGLVFVDR